MSGNESDFFGSFFDSIMNPEKTLDEAWRKGCMTGNFTNYEVSINNIKMSGRKVYRNSQGRHKVV